MARQTPDQILVQRIAKTIASADSSQAQAVATRIGTLLQTQIKLNVRRQHLIDTGRLLNSIRFETDVARGGKGFSVSAGSWGVPYARIHEYGFTGNEQVKAHTRLIHMAFGRAIDPRTVEVRGHTRYVAVKARPYVRPAFETLRQKILDIIMEGFR